jgi:methyl-accepting chemotaxis protein
MPYNSSSVNLVTFVEQNANNISYLKNKMDTLYQEVQDISGNMTSMQTKLSSQSSQLGKVNDVVNKAQTSMPTTPPNVTGTSQTPATTAKVTNMASNLVPS